VFDSLASLYLQEHQEVPAAGQRERPVPWQAGADEPPEPCWVADAVPGETAAEAKNADSASSELPLMVEIDRKMAMGLDG